MEEIPEPSECAEAIRLKAIEKIVARDNNQAEAQQPSYGEVDQGGHEDQANSKYPQNQ